MNAKQVQVISTKTHGILDFLTVGFALTFPRVLGCSKEFTNAVTMIALGKLGYALMTKHELGVAKVFTPGAPTGEITGWVAEHFAEAQA